MSIRPKKQYDQLPITPIEIDIGKKKSEDETLFHQLEIEQPNNDGNNLDSNLFESMVNTSGMTIFQVEALLFTGLIYLLEGFQVSLSGLIFLPIVSHYQLSQLYGCIISSSLVFFMGIGSLFTGYLTLLWQRRFILIMGLTIIFLGNMFAVIQNYYIYNTQKVGLYLLLCLFYRFLSLRIITWCFIHLQQYFFHQKIPCLFITISRYF